MSKLEILKAFDVIGLPEQQIQSMVRLQMQLGTLSAQVADLANKLVRWGKSSQEVMELQKRTADWEIEIQQKQMLDLAVLIEPLVPTLNSILQKQSDQDERLSRMEAALVRVTMVLRELEEVKEGNKLQPKLSSNTEGNDLPTRV